MPLSPRIKIPPELRRLARLARSRGWRIRRTGRSHLLWISPRGRRVVTARTPRGRAVLNDIAHHLDRAAAAADELSLRAFAAQQAISGMQHPVATLRAQEGNTR